MSKILSHFHKIYPRQLLAAITAVVMFSYTTAPQPLLAAEAHVISLSELGQDLNGLHETRDKNLHDIERVLSLPAAQEALANARLTTGRVMTAIAELDDAELARLADRARAAEEDVEGGILVGLLALIGLVVVILIVVAIVTGDDEE